VCFISLIPRFPLQLFPLQLFQDHRDGNVEASGITVTCSFHQAIPGSLQVVVPVKHMKKGNRFSLNVGSETYTRESNNDEDLTPYQSLQAHVAFAFGTAAGGDVPQVVF
jgi:hypothetical protein